PGNESENFKKIFQHVQSTVNAAQERYMKTISARYIERLSSDPSSYQSLYEYGINKNNYAAIPFLHHLDAKRFAELLIHNSTPNISLFGSLERRYQSERGRDHVLSDEYEWLKNLKLELEALIKKESHPQRKLMEIRTTYY
ncbi:hypothetical protein, partial [Pandoraea sputorum]